MNFKLISIGLLFFLNPTYGIYDVLPDFAGAILIIMGMGGSFCINDKTEKAEDLLWCTSALSVLRCALALWGQSFDGTGQMLACCCLNAAEGAVLIYFFSCFAAGLENVKIRYGTLFGAEGGGSAFDVSKYRKPLVIYTALRSVLFTLPELTELRLAGKGNTAGNYLLTPFKGLLYIAAALICVLPFIFAVRRTLKTFSLLSADREMTETVKAESARFIGENPRRFAARKKKTARILFMCGAVFSVWFYVDNVNFIPKSVAALFFAALVIWGGDSKKLKIRASVLALLLMVSDTVSGVLVKAYYADYSDSAAAWQGEALLARVPMCAVTLLTASLTFALIFTSAGVLKNCSEGAITSEEGASDTSSRLLKSRRDFILLKVSAILLCVCAALYLPLRPFAGWIAVPQTAFGLLFLFTSWI